MPYSPFSQTGNFFIKLDAFQSKRPPIRIERDTVQASRTLFRLNWSNFKSHLIRSELDHTLLLKRWHCLYRIVAIYRSETVAHCSAAIKKTSTSQLNIYVAVERRSHLSKPRSNAHNQFDPAWLHSACPQRRVHGKWMTWYDEDRLGIHTDNWCWPENV